MMTNKKSPDYTEVLKNKQFQNFINEFEDEFFWLKDNLGQIYFSDNISKVTGHIPVELKSLEELIYEEDLSLYRKSVNNAFNNLKTEVYIEFRVITKENKRKWLKENIKIFYDENDKVEKTIGKVTDITREKTAEINLTLVNSELKDQNIAKDSFLNLLSHDLRSPFTSILGFTEILLKEPSLSESERAEYLTHINSSSEKLLHLINYLLDWSRLKSGKLKIENQKINLQSLVYNCVSSLTGAAVRKNIEIKVKGDKSIKILGDERLLNIVISNLINNSIKFSRGDSEIHIKTEKFNDELAELVVVDNGIGIPDENKIKLFKIEKMFSSMGTGGEKGTGFGLILSKEIIGKHGGELWFYSEEGKGSEFHITIPSSPEVFLIVESNPENLNMLSSIVKNNFVDYKIIAAKDSYSAINLSDGLNLIIIVLSHEIPLMSGDRVLETICGDKDHAEVKAIVLYDSITAELKNNYNKFGKIIFLEKKSLEDQLIKAVNDLLK